ncbi:o-succinylbenzoate synthase [Companilactobacillus zhongbaensis]|uniref:o-succinylbenzoate synthase n=1 Tax=Companilactobacillus zhongbaensis TaxID=2486009 RepID=UPI000F7B212A|nr:o-succinylbenzoate synthase [Companilactobacillus zhongbaensis]
MQIVSYKIHQFSFKLKHSYRFADAIYRDRPINIIALKDELGNVGLGEVEAFEFPNYIDETQRRCVFSITSRIMPLLGSKVYDTPFEFARFINSTNAPYMARAAVEMAIWDLFAKRNGVSVQKLMMLAVGDSSAPDSSVAVGVAIGIKGSAAEVIKAVQRELDLGYSRIKLKVNRHYSVKMLTEIRAHFPDVLMMIDCNSQFHLRDKSFFKNIDGLNFAMIEQPLGKKDFIDHAKLQAQIHTPLCLDENIFNSEDVWKVINRHSAGFINMKLARVGGISNALALSALAVNHGLQVWCGGMLETGIGRAFNLALASLGYFQFPGDISASNRYYEKDIINGEFEIDHGKITVPQGVGLGVELNEYAQEKFAEEEWIKI